MDTYFFDTYAFFELLEGNPDYDKYKNAIDIVTTKFNLMELHYGLLNRNGKEKADATYYELLKLITEIDDNIIITANQFKLLLKKRKLSYVDCLGYSIAITRGIKFLTGDKQFKDLENVEFVK